MLYNRPGNSGLLSKPAHLPSDQHSFLDVKENFQGWGDGLVGKVFVMTMRTEVCIPASVKMKDGRSSLPAIPAHAMGSRDRGSRSKLAC